MTITPSITSIIESLEQTADPAVAYFSFTTDETGEHGAICANKEGLRRYALELLKKSVELEENPYAQKLCFSSYEWLVSDAGYDLIRSVKPVHASRAEIMANPPAQEKISIRQQHDLNSSKLGTRLLIAMILTLCAVAAAIIYFT
jgi:hypothetical protein